MSVPTGSAVVATEHVPLASVQEPRLVPPTVKLTVPVGVAEDSATTASSVTLVPDDELAGVAVTVVVVGAVVPPLPATVSETACDVDAAYVDEPLYTAVTV